MRRFGEFRHFMIQALQQIFETVTQLHSNEIMETETSCHEDREFKNSADLNSVYGYDSCIPDCELSSSESARLSGNCD